MESSSETKNGRSNSAQAVFERIEREKIKMKSCCHFFVETWTLRLFSVLVLAFSAVFFGLAIYEVFGMKLYRIWTFSAWQILETFPFLLVLGGFAMVYFSSRIYRKSRICCRHEDWMLLTALFLVSILLSIIFFTNGTAHSFYEFTSQFNSLKILVL
jgi:hypothetical protein